MQQVRLLAGFLADAFDSCAQRRVFEVEGPVEEREHDASETVTGEGECRESSTVVLWSAIALPATFRNPMRRMKSENHVEEFIGELEDGGVPGHSNFDKLVLG